jgi:hypothetical protein
MPLIVQFLHFYNSMTNTKTQIYIQHILLVLTSPLSLLSWLLWWSIIGVLGWYFMDVSLIIWNQWPLVAYTELVLFGIFVVFFAFFIAVSVYKFSYFQVNNTKQLGRWSIWWFLSMLVVWCPACSITLASYVGLASLISFLPFQWFELKVIGIWFLVYANISSLRSLHTCAITQKKNNTSIDMYIRYWSYVIWTLICLRAIIDYFVRQGLFTF